MKIKLATKTLEKLVENCALVIDPITPLEILKELKLVATENGIEITGSNNTVSVICNYQKNEEETYECAESGTTIVDAKTLTDILKSISSENVALLSSENLLKIAGGKAKFQVNLTANNIYPNISMVETDKVYTIKAADLKRGIDTTLFASDHKKRYDLQCIRIDGVSDKITFTGTDGFAISQNSIVIDDSETRPGEEEFHFSLPQMSAALLSKYLVNVVKADKDAIVKLMCNDTKAKFVICVGNVTITIQSTLLTSRFPDIERAKNTYGVPKATLKVNKKELDEVLSRASLMVEDKVAVVTLSCTPERVRAISSALERGAFDEELEAEYTILDSENQDFNDFKITLVVYNVKQAIKIIESDTITIEFGGTLRPIIIRHSTEKEEIIEIISPMRTYN